jgi:hypothetical protein
LGELISIGFQFKAYVILFACTYKLLLPVYGVPVLASTDDIQMTLVLFKKDSCIRARQHSDASAKQAHYNRCPPVVKRDLV